MGFFDRFGPLPLHIVAVIHYMFTDYYFTHHMDLPNHGAYQVFHTHGGRYKFLTVWNMLFQAIFFWICLLNDLFGTNEVDPVEKPFLRKLRDFLHATIGFPLSLFVGSTFWSLWAVDRELVFPEALDEYFPVWLNHSMHSSIILYTLLHAVFCYNEYPSKATGIMTLLSVVCVYVGWLLTVHFRTGMWVYPIFSVLTWPQRILFLSVSVAFLLFQYLLGGFFNNLVWGTEIGDKRYKDLKKPA